MFPGFCMAVFSGLGFPPSLPTSNLFSSDLSALRAREGSQLDLFSLGKKGQIAQSFFPLPAAFRSALPRSNFGITFLPRKVYIYFLFSNQSFLLREDACLPAFSPFPTVYLRAACNPIWADVSGHGDSVLFYAFIIAPFDTFFSAFSLGFRSKQACDYFLTPQARPSGQSPHFKGISRVLLPLRPADTSLETLRQSRTLFKEICPCTTPYPDNFRSLLSRRMPRILADK